MTFDELWSELGIAPTEDRTAVRRAYAARLKLTNPEDDPETFKRLREAYELALAWADGRRQRAETAEPPSPEPPEATPSPPPQPQSPPQVDPADPLAEHWRRCGALIDKAAAGQSADDELVADLDAILKSPLLEHLEVFQHTGLGFARSLLEITPRGDILVWPVLNHFGWRKPTLGWSQSAEVEALRDLGARVTDRQGIRENRAYKILTSDPPRKGNRQARWERDGVRRLITAARSSDAWLLDELRPDTLKWWERYSDPKRAQRRKRYILLAVIGGFIGLLVLAGLQDDPVSPPPDRPLTPYGEAERLAVAADANTSDPESWAKLCAVTARHWWRESSLSDCDHAVTLNPGRPETQLDRGFLNLKVGRAAIAEKQFDLMLVDYPKNAVALAGRSLARSVLDDVERGRTDWCRAEKLDRKVREKVETIYEFEISGAYEPC